MKRFVITTAMIAALSGRARAEDRVAAERAFRTAELAYKAQNFAAAIHHYEAAYEALPLPEIAFSAAQAYRKQYRVDPKPEYVVRAIELYEIYLSKVKVGGRVSDAADNLGEMKLELAKLEAANKISRDRTERRERVTQLAVSPQLLDRGTSELEQVTTYRVSIDGKRAEAFVPIDVAPGAHSIRVEVAGYKPAELAVRAIEGVSNVVEAKLAPLPARVTITTESGAQILVDGRVRGVAPMAPIELAAGKHVITIARRGRELESREIAPRRGEAIAIDQPLERTFQRRTVRWVAIGAGAAAAVAIAAGSYAIVKDGDAEDLRAELDKGDATEALANRYDDAIASRDRFGSIAWVAGGIAVAGGLTALGLYWFDSPSLERVQLAPTTSGIVASGRF